MAFPGHIWDQLKSLTADELVRALERDGWQRDTHGGSQYIYRKAGNPTSRRVSVHMHPAKTFGAKMLKGLLDDTGWSIDDLHRLKLIR